jgi:hypothetical protein
MIIIAPIFLLLLGLSCILLVKGLHGIRVGDHPVCRRCGFDLFGQPAGTVVCGECGSSLSLPGAVVIGHRNRRTGLIAAGLFVLLPTLFAAVVIGTSRRS